MYEFHFDFLSPNSYLAHKVVPSLESKHGIEFTYVPVSIRGQFQLTDNKPTPVQIQGVKNKPEYLMLEIDRFCRKHGIQGYQRPDPFPFDSGPLLATAVAAQARGQDRAYIDAVYRAAYEDGLDMTRADTLPSILQGAGLPSELIDESRSDAVAATLQRNLEDSVARGTFGSPSFFVRDELFFGKDRFEQIEAEIEKTKTTP